MLLWAFILLALLLCNNTSKMLVSSGLSMFHCAKFLLISVTLNDNWTLFYQYFAFLSQKAIWTLKADRFLAINMNIKHFWEILFDAETKMGHLIFIPCRWLQSKKHFHDFFHYLSVIYVHFPNPLMKMNPDFQLYVRSQSL